MDLKARRQEVLHNVHHQAAKAPSPTTTLVTYAELPHWRQDNAYILTSYRPISYSFRRSFASIFYLHTEFVNIHSHLLGALIFACIPLYLYFRPADAPEMLQKHLAHPSPWTAADTLAFACFFAGAVVCLATSATFHTVSNHSPVVAARGNQLDYVGIVALISGSFVPSVYYGFYCEPHLKHVYWGMIGLLAVACTVVSVRTEFRTPQWRPFRAAMFVGMGCSAVFPVLHGLTMFGWRAMEHRIGLRWLLLQGGMYILGAGLYAARVPERLSPGTFDIWGSSHQIFHVLVVGAACSHLVGLLKAGEYAHSHVNCPA